MDAARPAKTNWRPRASAVLLLSLTWFVSLVPSAAAALQNENPSPPVEVSPDESAERATPRATMREYLLAARDARWTDAARFLDLSQIPESARSSRGRDLARQLKIVLDRGLWVDLDAISDEVDGVTDDGLPPERERIGSIASGRDELDVVLERKRVDGVNVWLFSARTLSRIPAAYAEIGLPKFVESLPSVFVDAFFLEVALWQWIGILLLLVSAWIASWIASIAVARLLKPLTARSTTEIDDRLLAASMGPLRLLLMLGALTPGLRLLRLSIPALEFADEVSKVLVVVAVAWLALRIVDLFASKTKDHFLARGQAGAAYLVPVGARAVKLAVLVVTLLAMLDTFGFDVTAIIAGLGVGGLAVALAAQKTIENVFGGIAVLVDQPVRPGDFCRFGDKLGTVEDIGLRSTRIRTLDRTVLSVPNADFSTQQIENFARRDRIRLFTMLGLRYETSPDQLRHVMAGIRRLLLAHPRVVRDPARIRFVGFGSSSLDLEIFAFVDTTDFNEFLAIREDIFLRIMDLVQVAGTGFAFPSTTAYLARDSGLDAERTRAAEDDIARARREGRLPFPDPSAEDIAALERTLDWPPKGSASAANPASTSPS